MATLTEYDGSVDDLNNIDVTNRASQSFKVAAGAVITGFSLKGSKGNTTPSTSFTAKIYEGGANPQAGTEIKSESFNADGLGDYTASPTFHDFTFATPTSAVTGGATQYYLVIIPDDGIGNDVLRLSIDTTSPSYAEGNRWSYVPSTWSSSATIDHNFKIYGSTTIDYIMAADVGAFTLTGIDTTFALGKGISVDVLNFTLTYKDIIFNKALSIVSSVGDFTLTGIDAIFSKGISMIAEVGSFILSLKNSLFDIWDEEDTITTSWTDETHSTNNWTEE